tara:strand:+ start:25 stop:246 length:222 start_codon:yes stop_codon:yes gene_type:complete
MKTFFLTFIASIASAFGFYIAIRAAFIAVVRFFDITLTYQQRLCVEDLGYFTFLLGGVIGGMVGWRIFRVNKA